jgi:hypothetical protein
MTKKHRGSIRMTAEMLKKALGLPEEVEIVNVSFDAKREIVDMLLRSNEEVKHLTFPTGESEEIRNADIQSYYGVDIYA